MAFSLTDRQRLAQSEIAKLARYFMLYGGSRSGKTFLNCRNIIIGAIKAPGARQAVFRYRLNHLMATVVSDTIPKVMSICFPGVAYTINKQEMCMRIAVMHPETKKAIESEIWFAGLDEKERVEKILGFEFVRIFFNECSQIPYDSVQKALTRLAQKIDYFIDGINQGPMQTRAFFDCNPPPKSHWTYKLFVQHVDPESNEPLRRPEQYSFFRINPQDNIANIDANYIESLGDLSAANRRRFLEGEFAEANPNALFEQTWIDRWRVEFDDKVPQLLRTVIAIDPSGQSDDDESSRNDEVGIVVVGLGIDGNAYVIEDASIAAGPTVWARVAGERYDAHGCGVAVAEVNYGGGMVGKTLKSARPNINYKVVSASKGKAVRAEPFSPLYEKGRIRHVGRFLKLEDELGGFSTYGYTGSRSPNRADALIWALTELFPSVVNFVGDKKLIVPPKAVIMPSNTGWMK